MVRHLWLLMLVIQVRVPGVTGGAGEAEAAVPDNIPAVAAMAAMSTPIVLMRYFAIPITFPWSWRRQ